jgi:hypothetical protein
MRHRIVGRRMMAIGNIFIFVTFFESQINKNNSVSSTTKEYCNIIAKPSHTSIELKTTDITYTVELLANSLLDR